MEVGPGERRSRHVERHERCEWSKEISSSAVASLQALAPIIWMDRVTVLMRTAVRTRYGR
jgi:hypothetical protein